MRLFCSYCRHEIQTTWEQYQKGKCSCNGFFCSEKCELEHSGGHTIEELKEMEGGK